MSVNRITLCIAGLSVLFSFLALLTDCSQQKSETFTLTVTCRTTINVNATGVDFPDAYICKDKKVTWIANGHIFSVGFKNGVCPIEGQGACKEIDTQQPTSGGPIYDHGIVITVNYFIPTSSAGVSLPNENLQFLHNETLGHVPRRWLPVVG